MTSASSVAAKAFPCSICDSTFSNPRDLGTHILSAHCDEGDDSQGQESADDKPQEAANKADKAPLNWSTVSVDGATPIPDALKAIQAPAAIQAAPTVIALPRPPTQEEMQQKFMMQKQSDFTTKYTCLLCSKVYTSRYNIRMHMNMHSGKNVHTCKHCGRYFAHKHVFESHVRTHTGEKPFKCQKCGKAFGDRSNCTSHQKKCKGMNKIVNANKSNNNSLQAPSIMTKENSQEVGMDQVYNDNAEKDEVSEEFQPQIVSVTSMSKEEGGEDNIIIPGNLSTLDVDDIIDDSLYDEDLEEMEEIEIEPDIIDYDADSNSESSYPDESSNFVLPQNPVSQKFSLKI